MDSKENGKSKFISLFFIIFCSGKTTHLILMTTEGLQHSKKLKSMKSFKNKPLVVELKWLFDCMELGTI
jgi:hypothetical protein